MEELRSNVWSNEDEDDYVYVFKKPAALTRGGLRGCAGTDERETLKAGERDGLFSEAMKVAFRHGLAPSSALYESLRSLQMVSSDMRETYQSAAGERSRVSAGMQVSWRRYLPPWNAVVLCLYIFFVFAVKPVS
ncbi:unnamed protein product [Ectocarpus fasciculatus]